MSNQNAERVLNQVDAAGNWMANALDQLAAKMGTTVDYLWPIFVKEQVANGITLAVCSVIALAVCVFIWAILSKKAKKQDYPCDNDMIMFLAWMTLVIGIITFVIMMANAIPILVAPEAAALREIAKAVGSFR